MTATRMPARLWSVDDVAAYLGVPVETLYQWRKRKYGPPAARLASIFATTPTTSRRGSVSGRLDPWRTSRTAGSRRPAQLRAGS